MDEDLDTTTHESTSNLATTTTPKDDDATDSEDRFATPSLSASLIEEYRAMVRDLDAGMPLFTLPVQDFGDYDAHTLFPDLLLYAPPNPDYDDPYFDEIEYNHIVPLSALVTRKIKLMSDSTHINTNGKRAIDGEPIVSPYSYNGKEKKIKTLPQLNRYDSAPLVSRKCGWTIQYSIICVAYSLLLDKRYLHLESIATQLPFSLLFLPPVMLMAPTLGLKRTMYA
jgi:hypothetical protein